MPVSAASIVVQVGSPQVAASAKPIAPVARQAVIEKLAQSMGYQYVFPEVGERTAAAITATLARGDYNAFSDPAALAARLTTNLVAVMHDLLPM